ncbi:hypothetical protein [Streptomyces seoulensis]|uniref:hypothetical protein n=1 Tax=Streptomyces seoulensis TaxID=73044 RepID=UPI001FCCAA1E|nr:hypothetical protein [Streptomyces seoulensis]BDH04166.1 membrane protein [Streptomyces seoulensis]
MTTERPESSDRPEKEPAGSSGVPETKGGAGEADTPDATGTSADEARADSDARPAVDAGTDIDTGTDADADSDKDAEADTDADAARGTDADAARGTDADDSAGSTSPAPPDGAIAEPDPAPDAEGGRRPRSAAIVASVAAAVLLVGGGGAWLAAGAGAGAGSGEKQAGVGSEGAPPPLVLDGGPGTGAAGIAVGEPDPSGGVRYVVDGDLPDGPRSAPVHMAEGKAGKDAVARLARALGIGGAPVADGDNWQAGEREGGPVLRVNGADWSFTRFAPGTDNCRKVTVCSQDPVTPAHEPVGVAEAERVARPVLKALGQDDAKIDAGQVMGAQRVVNADPVVGGLPTYGWTTGLTVDEKGDIVGGHGMLGGTAKGDTYPVLSAADTVKLMNKAPAQGHRMGVGGCASPVPLKDRLEQPCGASTGSPAAPEADRVTVEKAVFGLAAHSVDGRQALVPSWLFEVRGSASRGGFTVAHPAVDPEYLASPSAGPADPSAARAPKQRGVTVEGYRAEGRKLTVRFIGGVCSEYRASARESAGRVTVTVTEKSRPGNCIALGKEYTRTVSLDAPLADRAVVGTDGGRVPESERSLTP